MRAPLGTSSKSWFHDYMTVYEANMPHYAGSLDEYLNHTHFYKLPVVCDANCTAAAAAQ